MSWLSRKIRKKYRKYFFGVKFKEHQRDLRQILDQIGQERGEIYFVQIGGNDGLNIDPIHQSVIKYNWKGIILEPQKMVFEERLKKNYEGVTNVILENKAVDKVSSERILYKIAFSDARWATGLASFDRETIVKHIYNGHIAKQAKKEGVKLPEKEEDYLTEETVSTTSIKDLLAEHKVETVDLFHIDTEGFDYEILKMIDLEKISPDYIYFEHNHLSISDWKDAIAMLEGHDYQFYLDKTDTFAFKNHSK